MSKMSVKNISVNPFQVKSLFVLCKDCIKVSLTKSHCATSHLDPVIVGSQMRINNPFLKLPTGVLEELIRSFTDCRSGKPLENNILVYLISPQLRNMRFAFYSEDCLRFFPYFEKLQVLILKNTTAGNFCLRSIGTHCAELRSLDVSGCFIVTDVGMSWLFTNVENFEMAGKPHRTCNTLRHLNILHTGVTVWGVEKAIKCCPSLAILENDNTFEALVKLANETTEKNINHHSNGCKPTNSLRVLNIPCDMIYRSDSLRLVLPLCISINHVTVHAIKGFRDCDLLSLKSIEKLAVLKILRCRKRKVNDETEITFDGGVAPLLQVVGKSLEIFEIQLHLDSLRVSTIIEYCPHLVSLSIGEKFGTLNTPSPSVNEIVFREINRRMNRSKGKISF